ncbi:MAG: hypothetical protein PF692_11775 [Kiritimatiellae bacterium]|nr:hypothetical protein [Kiritimatiellia bacterium]
MLKKKKYIDLNLVKYEYGQAGDIIYSLKDIVKFGKLLVLLGPPGSGKSSILKKYHEDFKGTQLISVKDFIKSEMPFNHDTYVLLLDGLDEFRAVQDDKTFVITSLADKLNKLKISTVVLSCRDMDWFGEYDENALKYRVDKNPGVYHIQTLDPEQKNQLAKIEGITDFDNFISKYSASGFLENPQMFKMVAEVYLGKTQQDIKYRKDLYFAFVSNAREKNPEYKLNRINDITEKEFLQYVGYLGFYYIFNGIEGFDTTTVDRLVVEGTFCKDKINIVLNSCLFADKSFIHRTIAEFTTACFIKDTILGAKIISVSRIKSLFIKNKHIPTGLRGTFAWLCSLTEDKEFIAIDPYYQTIYGDVSHFSLESKQSLIKNIREYAKNTEPYFHQTINITGLAGIYDESLDDFFVKELKIAENQPTQYIYFIIDILKATDTLSGKMINFIKTKISDKQTGEYHRARLCEIFPTEATFLREVIEKISDGELKDDENFCKDQVLKYLYPDQLTSKEFTKYLKMYKEKSNSHRDSYFLIYTDFVKKIPFVTELYESSYDTEESKLSLPSGVESFISDFFCELICQFLKGKYDAKYVYNMLKEFSQYYKGHHKFPMYSYRTEISESLSNNDIRIEKLSNELFRFYIDDYIKEDLKKQRKTIYDFDDNIFPYKQPTERIKILFNKIESTKDKKSKLELLYPALRYLPEEKRSEETIVEFVNKNSLSKEYQEFMNPPKQPWEEEHERREKEREEETKIKVDKNESFFSSMSDVQIRNHFGALKFVSGIVFFDKGVNPYKITNETCDRLKSILKGLIRYPELYADCSTLQSAVKESPCFDRPIDKVYYACTSLQDLKTISVQQNKFYKYLYINDLRYLNCGGAGKTKFSEVIKEKSPSFALSTLKEYINLLFYTHVSKRLKIFKKRIDAEIDDSGLVNFLHCQGFPTYTEGLLQRFLKYYNFSLTLNELQSIEKHLTEEENIFLARAFKSFKNREQLSMDEVVALFSFEHEFGKKIFVKFNSIERIYLLNQMMDKFNTLDLISFKSGWVGDEDRCARFMSTGALDCLSGEELEMLSDMRLANADDIWNIRLLSTMNKKSRKQTDEMFESFSISGIKEFILRGDVLDNHDFFVEVCERINALKNIIEANRNNNIEPFYKDKTTFKNEEACRDEILRRLEDKYQAIDLNLIKEKYEGNNKVDISIEYKANQSYEVQVECKKEGNPQIYTGVKDQLIDKYLARKVKYGIYLVFFTGKKLKKIDRMISNIEAQIPEDYKDRIEIICIDLRK